MKLLSDKILAFLATLTPPTKLPKGVEVLNPYSDREAWALCRQFYKKFYSDDKQRALILGINPGRFGGGTTGIPFTDPLKLEKECGIRNNLKKKTELSADFIYQMIAEYGGPEKFYQRFYISSVSPLGFTRGGKNLNYYDIRELEEKITHFMLSSLHHQLEFGLRRDICYCLGEGDNFKFLSRVNSKYLFFKKIIPLAHPRFILQYRRKKTGDYIKDYLQKFELAGHQDLIFAGHDQPGTPPKHF